jgi:aryl-alcohol dehydrogenase-like predicted oxidoreductase
MRLALGTAQFGFSYGITNRAGQVSKSAASSILELAASNGINMLDTAVSYGLSEATLGLIGIKNFKLVTKLPQFPGGCDLQGWVSAQISESFFRLNIDSAYGVLLHTSQQLEGINGVSLYRALQSLKDKGLASKVGISIYSPKELDSLCAKFHFDLVQAPFNLVDRRLLDTGWISRLKDKGIEIHTRSTFLQGLLLMNQAHIPLKFKPWKAIFDKWHNYLNENDISALDASLAYPLSFPEIDKIIVGVQSRQELMQILAASTYLPNIGLPNLSSVDQNFVNPTNWSKI